MSGDRVAIVLGGAGSVGAALLTELLRDDGFGTVVALVRRPLPTSIRNADKTGGRLVEHLVPDMTPEHLAAAIPDVLRTISGEVEGFSALGVGARTASLTLEQHRAVDVTLNGAFARALRDSGRVRHLSFLSAVGADARASTGGSGAAGSARYRRVKGESEATVQANGPSVVSVFRPAMIIGSQHTPWVLEKTLPLFSFITPAKYRSIRVDQIARAMIAAAKQHPATSAVYHYAEMLALGENAGASR
ncbi:MAG: NAD(P)H-binding protein [Gemmatimonadaceae bacterium]